MSPNPSRRRFPAYGLHAPLMSNVTPHEHRDCSPCSEKQTEAPATTERKRLMTDLILTTYDWVPEAPRGYVRDLRVRWALE